MRTVCGVNTAVSMLSCDCCVIVLLPVSVFPSIIRPFHDSAKLTDSGFAGRSQSQIRPSYSIA